MVNVGHEVRVLKIRLQSLEEEMTTWIVLDAVNEVVESFMCIESRTTLVDLVHDIFEFANKFLRVVTLVLEVDESFVFLVACLL